MPRTGTDDGLSHPFDMPLIHSPPRRGCRADHMTTGINTPAVQQLMERVIGSADGVILSRLARSGSAHTGPSAYEYSAQDGVGRVNAKETIPEYPGRHPYPNDLDGAQAPWIQPLPGNGRGI